MQFEGELVAGTESELTLTVSRDGQPVMDLEPYLGALGHLVAIREGDLAYLHVHPLDETEGAGGPMRFAVEVPTAGRYALFFDFSHGGVVRTASLLATANAGRLIQDDDPSAQQRDRPGDHGHDVRLVCGAHREAPQRARRSDGDRELRHGAGEHPRRRWGDRRRADTQVEGAGYKARDARPAAPSEEPIEEPDESLPLRQRLIVSALLSLPVVVLAMVPALQFDYWQWLSLTLAAPVVTWGVAFTAPRG